MTNPDITNSVKTAVKTRKPRVKKTVEPPVETPVETPVPVETPAEPEIPVWMQPARTKIHGREHNFCEHCQRWDRGYNPTGEAPKSLTPDEKRLRKNYLAQLRIKERKAKLLSSK